MEACFDYEYCHLCLLESEACRYFARYDITKTWPNILIDELSIAGKTIVSNVGQKFNIHRTQVQITIDLSFIKLFMMRLKLWHG
jgi:hypothetical protein